MRLLLIAFAASLFLSVLGCSRPIRYKTYRMFTGTCPGACDYYVMCKQRQGDEVGASLQAACVNECSQVFSSPDSIIAFESLLCEDAVAFVEGEHGREPGTAFVP
jgi:predicted permease